MHVHQGGKNNHFNIVKICRLKSQMYKLQLKNKKEQTVH
jgi:hypothetical protein